MKDVIKNRKIGGVKHRTLWIITIILILHAFILIFYLENYRKEQRLETESIFAFIETVQLVSHYLPPAQTEEIIDYLIKGNVGLDNYLIKASTTSEPQYKMQFLDEAEAASLKNYLDVQIKNVHFSYKLNNFWLNLSITSHANIYHVALLCMVFELLLFSGFLLFWWLRWRFSSSLHGIKQAVQKIGSDLNITLPADRKNDPTPVREVSEEIKRMQQRIHSLLDSRAKLVATIAHDLRTPITRLKLLAQFLTKPQTQKIMHNLEEMEQMINGIFAFATVDNAHDKKVKTDISALLQSLCEDFSDMGHEVDFKCPEQRVLVNCRFLAIKRAFTNIIENAVKYGKKSHIILEQINDKQITILFEDEGPGIPTDKLNKVLEAYYRLEQSTNRIQGMGLGLTIAYEIIDGHNGTISLENIEPTGLRIKIILPKT